MPGSLEGVEAKIRRAKAHLAELDGLTKATARKCREAVSRKYDHERSVLVFRIESVPSIDPEFSLILGDAVHNLRCALDHLAWQLVLATGDEGPDKRTSFPIHENPLGLDRFKRPITPTIEPGVSGPVRERLHEVQPHLRRYPANHQLAVVNNLDVRDKHHRLVVTVVGSRGAGWFGEVEPVSFNSGPYEPGDEIAAFVGADLHDESEFDPHFTFAECFDDAAAGATRHSFGAAALLRHQPLAYIEAEVLPRFREFF